MLPFLKFDLPKVPESPASIASPGRRFELAFLNDAESGKQPFQRSLSREVFFREVFPDEFFPSESRVTILNFNLEFQMASKFELHLILKLIENNKMLSKIQLLF